MLCPKCGTSNLDGAKFCANCHKPLPSTTYDPVTGHCAKKSRRSQRQQDQGVTYAPVHVQERRQPWYQKGLIFVVAVAVVAAGAYGVSRAIEGFNQSQADQAAYDEAHRQVIVTVGFDIPEYAEGSSSVIPISVEGTDLDGNAVSELKLLSLSNTAFSLARGTYTFTPAGTPVTLSGVAYQLPDAVEVTIDENGVRAAGQTAAAGEGEGNSEADGAEADDQAGESVDGDTGADAQAEGQEGASGEGGSQGDQATGPVFAYTPIAAENITDELMDQVRAWMTDAGIEAGTVQEYLDALANARRVRNQEIAAENEQNERSQYNHVTTDYFEFDIPELWQWRVDQAVTTDSATGYPVVTIHYEGYPQLSLMSVRAYPITSEQSDDTDDARLAYTAESGSVRVEIWSANWAWRVASGAVNDEEDVPRSILSRLVRMSSGDTLTYDEAREMSPSDVGDPDITFIEQQIAPTLQIK